MDTRVAWVTGASAGIGRAVAAALTDAGFHVYASARRTARLAELESARITPLPLDVTDPDAVVRAASQIEQERGRIDVLVNNAGYGLYGTIEGCSEEEIRRQFDVNVFGLGRVTRAALPIMRRQEAGRIINIASVVGKLALPFAGWYSATKHAVEAISDALRLETSPFGIRVIVIEPGAIKTEFDETALAKLDASPDPEVYGRAKSGFRSAIEDAYRKAPGPEVVAKAVVHAATARRPRRRYAVPADAKALMIARRILTDGMFDRILLRVLRLRNRG
ncbi:oxidoreductase [Thermostilla marina]